MIYSVLAAVAQSRSKLGEYTSRRDIVIVVVVVIVVVPMTGFSTRLLAARVHFCGGWGARENFGWWRRRHCFCLSDDIIYYI